MQTADIDFIHRNSRPPDMVPAVTWIGHATALVQSGGFDLALIAIGACLPRWFMRMQHVDLSEAVQVHLDLGAKHSVGVHWGTFSLSDEPLPTSCRERGIDKFRRSSAYAGLRLARPGKIEYHPGTGAASSRPASPCLPRRAAMPNYRFGKHPPKVDYRTLRLKNYLKPALPPPAPSTDVLAKVYKKLKISNPTKLFPMDANDTLGDCTIAALAHAETVYNGLVGKKEILAAQAVVKVYMTLTKGVDSGLNELDVLNYWQSTGVDGDKIMAFVGINPKNHTHVQQAIQLFGGVYLGFQVQRDAIQDFDARRPWTPGPLTNDGHAVYAVGYDAAGVTVLTWGNTQKGTWAWWDECVDEAYGILPPQAKQSDFSPGFDFAQLKLDLAAVAN